MRRVAASAVLSAALVLLQLTVVDRLSLAGRGVPDVALLAVIVLGATRGPATGMLIGFVTGLCLDLAPPASDVIGRSAFVFCLAGYGCGLAGGRLKRSNAGNGALLAAVLVGAVMAEALQAAIGMLAGDRGVDLAAVRHVLPVAALYDVLLAPTVLFLVALAGRRPVRPAPGSSAPAARLAGAGTRNRRRASRERLTRPTSQRQGVVRRGAAVARVAGPRRAWPRGRLARLARTRLRALRASTSAADGAAFRRMTPVAAGRGLARMRDMARPARSPRLRAGIADRDTKAGGVR